MRVPIGFAGTGYPLPSVVRALGLPMLTSEVIDAMYFICSTILDVHVNAMCQELLNRGKYTISNKYRHKYIP
jgi:hypothetical protein